MVKRQKNARKHSRWVNNGYDAHECPCLSAVELRVEWTPFYCLSVCNNKNTHTPREPTKIPKKRKSTTEAVPSNLLWTRPPHKIPNQLKIRSQKTQHTRKDTKHDQDTVILTLIHRFPPNLPSKNFRVFSSRFPPIFSASLPFPLHFSLIETPHPFERIFFLEVRFFALIFSTSCLIIIVCN